MDICISLFPAAKCSMDIYASLFSASIALAGFIAVFLVFRYRTIDTYVDNGKARIRSILEEQIRNDPRIDVIVQDIGKKETQANDVRSFHNLINREVTDKELANKTKDAVTKFVENIHTWRRLRNRIVYLGLTSIVLWIVLSVICLIGPCPCPFSSFKCCATVSLILTGFVSSMVLTLCFVFYSLLAKRPE
jgi:hypothetical protein